MFWFFLRAGHPLGSKRAQGHPLVSEGRGSLLKMPSKSTSSNYLFLNNQSHTQKGGWKLELFQKFS
jgi:hypothetical protein